MSQCSSSVNKRRSDQIAQDNVNNLIVGILRKSPTTKKVKRRVTFVDSIGKVLVQIREIPKIEHNDEEIHIHEQTDGKYIRSHTPDLPVPWRLIKCDAQNNLLNKPRPPSKSFLAEDARLTREQISSAPLFGHFDVIENPLLDLEALQQQNQSLRQIPIDPVEENNSIGDTNILALPEKKEVSPPSSRSHVLSLVDKLKRNGLIGQSNASSSSSSSQSDVPIPVNRTEPANRYANRNNSAGIEQPIYPTHNQWKHEQACTFYVFRQEGCIRGDTCRYKHDEQQRRDILRQKQEEKMVKCLQQQEIRRRNLEAKLK